MLEFIQLIKQRYQTAVLQLDKNSPQFYLYQQRIEQLLYAEAFIRKGQLQTEQPHFPWQIAVIGPTQTGKSSVVNLLLNTRQAGVSPLAGYTVHPHGYCHALGIERLNGLQHYFGRFQCLDEALLSSHRYDCYSLSNSQGVSNLLPACVCWDTPDFDSIDATDYREGVIRTIALADVIVLVVSKEKYADQSVWDVMQTIASFQQPTLICINKLSEGGEAEILQSFQEKWQRYRQDALPDIIPLYFQKQDATPVWPVNAGQVLNSLFKKVKKHKHAHYRQHYLQHYWQQWLEPVYAEHTAQQSWQMLIDHCIRQALDHYQRDYLNHPHHYQTFQEAVVKLLNLLELPGLAPVMSKTRRMMTWPVRKLMNLGVNKPPNITQEVMVLNQIGEHLLIQLADRLLEKTETEAVPVSWWKDTAVMLRQARPLILEEHAIAVDGYQQSFQQDVTDVAQRLYQKLQEQPTALNGLRVTRFTTDAAAIVIAIQFGGIGIHDLILTPMMLTITSLLAESAIGGYMARLEAELKQHQLNTVKTLLFDSRLRQRLIQLPQQCHALQRFNISEQQCQQAEQALNEKKHGLRIL